MIPPVDPKHLTDADKAALRKMPAGWFEPFDTVIRRARFRCDRLHMFGYLEYKVIGEYPNLESRYRRKKTIAREVYE